MSNTRRRASVLPVVLGILAWFPLAASADESLDYLARGDAARLHGRWAEAASAYEKAREHAAKEGNAKTQVEAALKCAAAVQALVKQDPAREKAEIHRLVVSYNAVLDLKNAPPDRRELAANNLGVLYNQRGEADNAVKAFRRSPSPSNPDSFLFHYNFGRALESQKDWAGALAEYEKSLRKRPQFAAAADAATRVCLAWTPRPYSAAAHLIETILPADPEDKKGRQAEDEDALTTAQRRQKAGEVGRKLLAAWGNDRGANPLWTLYLRYLNVAGMGPREYQEIEQTAWKGFAGGREVPRPVEELKRVFLPDYFQALQDPLFPPEADVWSRFPQWRGIVGGEEEGTRAFSRLLSRCAAFYAPRRESSPKDSLEPALHQALARYSAAFALDATNIAAAMNTAALLSDYARELDSKGQRSRTFVEQIFEEKINLFAKAKTKDDWQNLYSLHVVLANLYEKRPQLAGSGARSAVFQWRKAIEAEGQVQTRDPSFPSSPDLRARLAQALRQNNASLDSVLSLYLEAAAGFAYADPEQAAQVLKALDAAGGMALLSEPQKLRYQRIRSALTHPLAVDPRKTLRHEKEVSALHFLAEGHLVTVGGGGLMDWNVERGESRIRVQGVRDWAALDISQDAKVIASAFGPTVKVSYPDSKREPLTLQGHTQTVNAVKFSWDSKILATAGTDETIKVWSVERGRLLRTLMGAPASIETLAISRDGKRLAAGSGKQIRLWDPIAGQLLHTLEGHTGSLWSVAFSPDGKMLATASSEGTIRLWEVESGREFGVLRGHVGAVHALAFAPNGQQLVSGGADETVRLWDVVLGQEQRTLASGVGVVSQVAYAPDGQRFAASGSKPEVALWRLK